MTAILIIFWFTKPMIGSSSAPTTSMQVIEMSNMNHCEIMANKIRSVTPPTGQLSTVCFNKFMRQSK